MRGTIDKRGASWRIRLDIGTDLETGKRRVQRLTVRGSKRDAQKKLNDMLKAIGDGAFVEPSRLTVGEHCRARLQQWTANGDISAKTAERYGDWIEGVIVPYLGAKPLQALTTLDIEQWHTALRTKGRKAGGKGGLAPRSIGHAHRILRKALGDAMRHRQIVHNVCGRDGQRAPKVPESEIEIIPHDRIGEVIDKLRGRSIYPKAITLLFSGLRRGELLALRWSDVDLDGKVLRVRQAIEETRAHGRRVKSAKTKAGRRELSLPDIVVEALSEHRRDQLEWRMKIGAGKLKADALVFPARDGGLASPRNLSGDWREAVDLLGLPDTSLHALRHSHASQLIDAGIDVVRISKRLGHASPEITLRVYAHLFRRDDRESAAAINAALAGLGKV